MKKKLKAGKLQYKTILKAVLATSLKHKIDLDVHQLEMVATHLKNINDILSKCDKYSSDPSMVTMTGRKVFAICEKEPRNLDSGRHYYSVHYIKDNEIQKAWFFEFIKIFGGYDQNRDRYMDKYIFGSGVIGMSRVLDATDGLFSYLRRIGGFYAQIECR